MPAPHASRSLAAQCRAVFRPDGVGVAAAVLAAATLGMMFKQLRLFGGTFGPFEIAALAATLWLLAETRLAAFYQRSTWPLLAVLGAFLAGALVSALFFPGHFSPRDLIATLFVGLVLTGWLSLGPRLFPALDLLRGLAGLYTALIVLGVTLASGPLGLLWYKLIMPWRLQGLSDNPNQLASLCIAAIALNAAAILRKGRVEGLDVALIAAPTLAGLMSDSFAFIFSVTLVPALVLLVKFLVFCRSNPAVRRYYAVFYLGGIILGILVFYYFGPRLIAAAQELYYGGTGKGVVRLSYWLASLKTALLSPVVGFGPGAHISAAHTDALQEGHNILVDLMMSGGLVAVAVFVALVWQALGHIFTLRTAMGLFAALALLEFGLFQTVIRHAHYWVAWIGLVATLEARAEA